MEILNKSYKLSASIVIAFLLFALLAMALYVYWCVDNPGGKWGGLAGGLAAGMVVAIIQFFIAWQDFRQTEKIKELKLIEILYNRTSRQKYAELIKSCNRELDVMGVTAVRFFNDFADTTTGAPDDAKVLLHALDRGVNVRVLLPACSFLPETKKTDVDKVKSKYEELVKRYPNIEIKYFNHTAAHSIFRIDDTCIVGPVFPDLESRNTPALYMMKSSPFALNYIDYFEQEWKGAKRT